jgi:hypothetical protein
MRNCNWTTKLKTNIYRDIYIYKGQEQKSENMRTRNTTEIPKTKKDQCVFFRGGEKQKKKKQSSTIRHLHAPYRVEEDAT